MASRFFVRSQRAPSVQPAPPSVRPTLRPSLLNRQPSSCDHVRYLSDLTALAELFSATVDDAGVAVSSTPAEVKSETEAVAYSKFFNDYVVFNF